MQYIDPYDLFQLDVSGPEAIDRNVLKRARQRILAEFELSEEVVIQIKGVELDKSTALGLLEELEDPVKCRHHWYLHSQPMLRDFLREEKLRYLRYLPAPEDLGDKEFRKFLSQQIAPIFDKHLAANIRKGRRPEVSLILQHLDLISSWDLDTALRGAIRYFNQNVQEIKQLVAAPSELRQADTSHLYEGEQVKLLNRFPSVYKHLRNRYAEALRELAEAYENKLDATHTAYAVICVATELDTDLSTAEYINYLKVEYWRRKRAKDQKSWTQNSDFSSTSSDYAYETESKTEQREFTAPKRSRRPQWYTILFIFIGLLGLLRLCNARRSSVDLNLEALPRIQAPELMEGNSYMNRALNAHLFLFDSLNTTAKNPYAGELDISEPETSAPYSDQITNLVQLSFGIPRIQFRNESEVDAVVFFVSEGGHIRYHRFVSAGRTLYFGKIPQGKYGLKIYAGNDWRADAVPYYQKEIGGFTRNVTPVTEEPLTFESGEQYFKMERDEEFNSDRVGFEMELLDDLTLTIQKK